MSNENPHTSPRIHPVEGEPHDPASDDDRSYSDNERHLKKLRGVIAIGFKAIQKVRGEIAKCDDELDELLQNIRELELATDEYVNAINKSRESETAEDGSNDDTPTDEQRDAFIARYIELKVSIEEYNTVLERKECLKKRYQRLKDTEVTRIQQIRSTELTLSEQKAMIAELESLKKKLEAILNPPQNSDAESLDET